MFYFGKVLFTAFIVATSTSAHVRGTETDGSSTNQALSDDTEVTTAHQTGELGIVHPVTDDVEDEEERSNSLSWATKLGISLKLKWKAATKSADMKTIERLWEKEKQLRRKALEEKAMKLAYKRYRLLLKHGINPNQYYKKMGLEGQGAAVNLKNDPRFLDYGAFSTYWRNKGGDVTAI